MEILYAAALMLVFSVWYIWYIITTYCPNNDCDEEDGAVNAKSIRKIKKN